MKKKQQKPLQYGLFLAKERLVSSRLLCRCYKPLCMPACPRLTSPAQQTGVSSLSTQRAKVASYRCLRKDGQSCTKRDCVPTNRAFSATKRFATKQSEALTKTK